MGYSDGVRRPQMHAHLKIRNTGQTPAYEMRGKGAIRYGKKFDPRWIDDTEFFSQNTYMLPGAKFDYKIVENAEDIGTPTPPDNPPGNIYVFGRLEYRDAFKHQRWSNFRYIIGGEIERGHGTIAPTEEGNDAN